MQVIVNLRGQLTGFESSLRIFTAHSLHSDGEHSLIVAISVEEELTEL